MCKGKCGCAGKRKKQAECNHAVAVYSNEDGGFSTLNLGDDEDAFEYAQSREIEFYDYCPDCGKKM